jgi:hypothetical protein
MGWFALKNANEKSWDVLRCFLWLENSRSLSRMVDVLIINKLVFPSPMAIDVGKLSIYPSISWALRENGHSETHYVTNPPHWARFTNRTRRNRQEFSWSWLRRLRWICDFQGNSLFPRILSRRAVDGEASRLA